MKEILKRKWLLCLGIFLVLRLIASYLGYVIYPNLEPEQPDNPVYAAALSLLREDSFSQSFINVWARWDTSWYLKIAAFGYDPVNGTTAYLPLYPFLIAALGALTGDFMLSALIVSNLAALAVFILFYEVARVEGLNSSQAGFAVVSLAIFPTAFFFFAAYTDSLFMAFALGAWLSARYKHWLTTGILSGLATLTRMQGVLLMPVLGLLWLREVGGFQFLEPASWRKSLTNLRDNSWLGLLLPGMVFLGWNFYLGASGLGAMPDMLVTHWGIRTVPPWTGVWLFLIRLFTTRRVFVDYIDLGTLIFIIIFLIYGARRLDPMLSLYSWLNLALFFMRGTPPHLLDSFSRYMLAVFPAFLVMGKMRNHTLRLMLWMFSFILLIFLLMGFLDRRWIA